MRLFINLRDYSLILLKRLFMTMLFIASITQAMAGAVMPYQMKMAMNQSSVSAPEHGMAVASMSMVAMTDVDSEAMNNCHQEHDCCSGICSLNFISNIVIFHGVQPVSPIKQDTENDVIATTSTLYRPPILG